MNVDHMLEQISYEQFLEWRAFDELDPFGEERMDVRVADIVTTYANIHRREHAPPFTRDQFMLYFGDHKREPKPQQSWQSMKATGMHIFTMIGDGKSQGS